MQNKYPHRKKWLKANLKDKPGKRPLGSSTARRKLSQTSTLIVYCPQPIPGRETQPSQHPARVRREFTPWSWQVQALVTTQLAQAAGRPGPVPCSGHRRDIAIQGIQENRVQKQPWLMCLLQGPQQLQQKEHQRKGYIYTGSLPGFASTFPP